MENQSRLKSITSSTTFKMFVIGILVLILLIPLAFIQNLVKERERTRDEAIQEIHKDWGGKIILYGPVLKVPYYKIIESTEKDQKTGKIVSIQNKVEEAAYFFPETLTVNGEIVAQKKKRGIYKTSVYKANANLNGKFNMPDFTKLEIDTKNVLWDKAQWVMQCSTVKGITKNLKLKVNGKKYLFKSDDKRNVYNNDIYEVRDKYGYQNNYNVQMYMLSTGKFNLKDMLQDEMEYKMNFSAHGSENFQIIPVGKETNMELSSAWKDADFFGEYLPYNEDKITDKGFDAHWKVLEMNRPFGQNHKNLPSLLSYAFGVHFLIPVDNYQQNERSVKYGYLVVALTFLLFFLVQNISKVNIHSFQYLLIGLAMVIFYTLLLSISEHSSFNLAYLISASATILLIGWYAHSILKKKKFSLFISLALAFLYGFIFVIIQLESYALLVGSIGLFLILASVMYFSRKIDWNN